MITSRLGLLLLLMITYINPTLNMGEGPVDFILLIDDSASMENKITDKIWSEIGRSISTLPADSRLAIVRFAKEPVLELPLTAIDSKIVSKLIKMQAPPRLMPLDESASQLSEALGFVRYLIKPERVSTVLIIHDGQQTGANAKDNLDRLNEQVKNIFQLQLTDSVFPDAWVDSLYVPMSVEQHQLIPVSFSLGSTQSTIAEVGVWLNEQLVEQQSVQLQAKKLTAKQFNVTACSAETCQVRVTVRLKKDSIQRNNTREAIVSINRLKPVLYIHTKLEPPPLLYSLLGSKYKVDTINPDLCLSSVHQLTAYRTIVLDDIAIGDLSLVCWKALDDSVRKDGVGLIVLGGMNSFSGGSYRHSLLERLLPVTSEASQPEQTSTLLFLVDKSGSMDNDSSGNSRIAMAKQAIIETIKSLQKKDSVGLISFDAKEHLLLPIQVYDDPAQLIRQRFTQQPAGGTKLKPALAFALTELEKYKSKQSLLILVTDGYLDELDLANLFEEIQRKKVILIVMAIGQNTKTQGLKQLAEGSGGRFLQVNNVAEMPLLMRKEIEQRQVPIETSKTGVEQLVELPFLKVGMVWPDLSAYRVSKVKQGSTVYLQSTKGDPLWVMHFVGAGQVIAIPGGLGQWAKGWLSWNSWPVVFQGLINSVSMKTQHPYLDIRLSPQGNGDNNIQIDAITSSQEWLTSSSSGLTILNSQQQQVVRHDLPFSAAGRYSGTFTLNSKGAYKISVNVGEYSTFFYLFSNKIQEYIPSRNAGKEVETFKGAKSITGDNIVTELKGMRAQDTVQLRGILLISIFLFYAYSN